MKIVAIMNRKGGVGKTTLTANLAAGLAEQKKRILAIDLDTQCSLTASFYPKEIEPCSARSRNIREWCDSLLTETVVDLSELATSSFETNNWLKKKSVQEPNQEYSLPSRLDLICGSPQLQSIADEITAFVQHHTPTEAANFRNSLRKALTNLEPKYDFILIDCAPYFDILNKMAVIACDYLLVPVKPDGLAVESAHYFIRNVEDMLAKHNTEAIEKIPLKTIGIVLNGVNFRTGNTPEKAQQEIIKEFKAQVQYPIWESMLRDNRAIYYKALQEGVPAILGISDSQSQVTYQEIKKELHRLIDEFLKKIG